MTPSCVILGFMSDLRQLSTWTLEYRQRPWTTNAERAANRWQRARLTKEWREAYFWLAKSEHIPPLDHADIHVEVFQHGGRLQDTAACNPAVKAAIDGLVDAGVFPDDSPRHVRSITFRAPQRGKSSLILHIHGCVQLDQTEVSIDPIGERP